MEVAESAVRAGVQRVQRYYYEPQTLADLVESLKDQETGFIAGVASPSLKREICRVFTEVGWQLASVIDPTAVVSPSAEVAPGCFVAPQAVVSSNVSIDSNAIIHIHASVGHDSRLGECVGILPGARISGNVDIDDGTIVGSNAFVAAGVRVGKDCRIDAQAYVEHDLPDYHIVSPRYEKPIRRVVE